MEWFYKLLHRLIDHYVYENERDAAKSYVDAILESCLDVCAKNIPVDVRGLYRLYGVDLVIQGYKGNKDRLWRMKDHLSDLAYEYLLVLMSTNDKKRYIDIILEAEDCLCQTMPNLKWPQEQPHPASQAEKQSTSSEETLQEEGTFQEESTLCDENTVQDEHSSQEEDSIRVESHSQDTLVRLKIPSQEALRREIALMFNQVIRRTDQGKTFFSLETRLGVLSKLFDVLHGLHALPNAEQALVLQSVLHLCEIPDKKTSELYQRIGQVNPSFTTAAHQKFDIHLRKELYHLAINHTSDVHDVHAAAERLYRLLWELLNSPLTRMDIQNLMVTTLQNLKKCLKQAIPPLIDARYLDRFPPTFFKTDAGQEFYVHLHKELYELSINQTTEDDLIKAADRLYLLLWEIDNTVTPAHVTDILRASQQKLMDEKIPSLFNAVHSIPFPDAFGKTDMGYLFLEHLQNEVIRLSLNPKQNEHDILIAADRLYSVMPHLLTGVTQTQLVDVLEAKFSKWRLNRLAGKGAQLYTLDLMKYAAYANRILGGTIHDEVLNQQVITHFKFDKKGNQQQWGADSFAQLFLGLMILYIKQDEGYFPLSTGSFWKNNFLFLDIPSPVEEIGIKQMLSIEKEVFALIDHNTMIGHERLQQFVNRQPAEMGDALLEECRESGDDFYREMMAYYSPSKKRDHSKVSSCLFFSHSSDEEDRHQDHSKGMEVEDTSEKEGACWVQ